MPPPERFSKDAVAAAAFQIVRKRGMASLTARNIAKKLNSYTAPVYQHYASMRELKREVLIMAGNLLLEYTARPYTAMVFRNIGTGYAVFAREERELFRAMFLERDALNGKVDDFMKVFIGQMGRDERLTSLTTEEKYGLLSKMWTYTHGLATLIWSGIITRNSDEEIVDALTEVGGVVIEAALKNSGN